MEELPSPDTIQKIASAHFLQQTTHDRFDDIMGDSAKEMWHYRAIGKGIQTTTFLMTLGDKQFALKLSSDNKFQTDTQTELWLQEKHNQNTPQIYSTGEGILPDITGKYFWSIQEYISGPLWQNAQINSQQLDSYIRQLISLHQVKHKGTTGWGKLVTNHNGESANFSEYVETFINKIQKCDFFDHKGRSERVMTALQSMQKNIGDMSHYEPVLIHNDAHPENVILDAESSCRLLDFGNVKWSCSEEEMAVIQTHCVGSRREVFNQILSKYRSQHPFNEELFQFFALLNACSKINTRKDAKKQNFLWQELIESYLK